MITSALLLCVSAFAVADQSPRLITFQARLTDATGAPLPDGVHDITFRIYAVATGGAALWSELHEDVPVADGLVNVLLGSTTSLDDPNGDSNLGDALPFGSPLFLGVTVDSSGQEMVPRHSLVPAFHAHSADSVGPNGVGAGAVQAGVIQPQNLSPTAGVPVGGIVLWWGDANNLPYGFELCDGENPAPGSLLVGPKPNLQGRFPRGVPVGGTRGNAGGTETIGAGVRTGDAVLTLEMIPSHTHSVGTLATMTSGTHTHSFPSKCTQSAGGGGVKVVTGNGTDASCPVTDSKGDHVHALSGETAPTGGIPGGVMPHSHPLTNSAVPILPPYLDLYYIIRVK